MSVWHEDDEFWEITVSKIFGKEQWEKAAFEVENIVSLLKLVPGAHVLDLCCGPGRHSIELARRGFHVTGVDRTLKYLEIAKKKAEKENLVVEFLQGDMRTFRREEAFDAVLSLYTSFSYFEDPEEDKQVLRNIYSSLKRDGKVIIELMGKEVLARIFLERDWQEENGSFFLQERKVTKDWGWIENRWIIVNGKECREFKVSHRLYSGTELSSSLISVGFDSVNLFGSLSGTPYDIMAERLVAVAIK